MKNFLIGLLTAAILAQAAAAQSGRRVLTPPKPAATPAPTTGNNASDETDSYSESKSNRPRPLFDPVKPKQKNKKQKETEQKPNQPAPPTADDTSADDEVVKIGTDLVTIPVSVFDRNGLYVPNLSKTDFEIYEDGKKQEVAYFGTSEKPFTVVLLIDVSPSTAFKIEQIHDAAIAFVNQLKPQDSVMVIEFDAYVNVLTDATNDREKIYKAIRKADFGQGTSIYDAVHSALTKRLNKIEGRKAVVLFTDGVDTTSYKSSYERTLGEAEEADALIFPIYYNTFFDTNGGIGGINGGAIVLNGGNKNRGYGTSSEEYALGKRYLEDLAAQTGGRVFRPESTPGGLTAAFEGIAEELRRQYNIGYYPIDVGQPGQRKAIKVRVNRPRLVIRARDSYIVGTTPANGQ